MSVNFLWDGDNHGQVVVGGYLLPHVKARKGRASGEPRVSLIVNGSFGLDVSLDEAERWLWWVGNAMAIAAGYTCLGDNCQRINPYARRALVINDLGGQDKTQGPGWN